MAKDNNDDTFDVTEVLTNAPVDVDEKKKALKRKARSEKAKEEQEEKRKINRESREKKKLLKEKNKKRKRGEAVSDDEEETNAKETDETEVKDGDKKTTTKKAATETKESKHGIWVGNLAFSTKSEGVRKFFKDCGGITRIKCPDGDAPNKNNKGFAHVYFDSAEAMEKAIAKSEQKLDGRALLIKNANNFERKDGAPAPTKETIKQKNPPCPTVFLGNLSFDATREKIQEHFAWCGTIRKVRLATFEDSGKCKGFAYIDFETVESATKAVRAPDRAVMDNRKLRVEFGSEEAHKRSMPWVKRAEKRQAAESSATPQEREQKEHKVAAEQVGTEMAESEQGRGERRPKRPRPDGDRPQRPKKQGRVAPGEALRSAQRQSQSVQKFEGTKISFGDN
ncbi:hypothetical protein DFQ28_004709 [Apophysomyces sp. BC1034]|nr:hypothetical protein DFQ30_004565 [Apophysomyces sp. BC1015]KAG0178279.1 hypothetical protein DFQ29_003687 [Apophysomyces sp. BC1021]KAG0188552.1 hypothetical protein DFQ28_004709 [Apophysomyces sp. BC1034]